MALNRNTQARIDVYIGGTEQAKNQLKEMRSEASKLREEIEEMKKQQLFELDTKAYDELGAKIKESEKRLSAMNKVIRDTDRQIYNVAKELSDLSGLTERDLRTSRKYYQQVVARTDPKDLEKMQYNASMLNEIMQELDRRKASVEGFATVFGRIQEASDKALSTIRQRLQELIATTAKNTQEMQTYREQLRLVQEEEQRRISSKAGRVMGNLDGSSVAEIQEAIKVTTQLRDAQKLGGQEWEIYNDEIQRAQKYLSDFNNLSKQISMSDRMRDLGKASISSLAELKKYWQEQVNGAQRGSQELAEYEAKLKQVLNEENKRAAKNAVSVFGNLNGSSLTEIQDAIKATTQLRDATELGSKQWDIYNKYIEAAKKYLSDFENTSKSVAMSDRMRDLGNASASSLAELKKYWQEQVDGAQYASAELQKYRDQLQQIEAEEQRRVGRRAQTTIGQVQTGTFDGTIGETREAVKLLEQYKQQLKTSDTKGIKEAEAAIASLNEKIRQTTAQFPTLDDALGRAFDVEVDNFNGTQKELEELKKSLEEYRKQLKMDDVDGFRKIDKALDAVSKKQKEVVNGTVDINDVMKRLRTAPLVELQKAAAQLQEELANAERNTESYVKASAQLRQVSERIDSIKKGWEQHDSQIVSTMKRLTSYVLVYAGFNEIVGRIKSLGQANLELSDSMADIQKTTGLSAETIAELGHEIDKIDTRTSQEQLYSLAAAAGQAGLSSKEDVEGFVRAADQLTIALNELGNDGVNTLLKISNLTGEGKLLGTEKALLAIGSSINELSAAGAATAGPITDIISRIGAVGSVAKLSMADMAAFGATMDELGQSAEVSGTAFNVFLTALQSNTTGIAMALGLDDKELDRMMKAGNTMEAVFMVLEKLRTLGEEEGLKALGPLLKEFGSEGNRMNTIITAMADKVDLLRERVQLSREAYAEATSVTEEANVKQESAIGILQRLGNEIKETFVNPEAVEWLRQMMSSLLEFVQWVKSGATSAENFRSVIVSLATGLAAFGVASKAAGASMFALSTYTTLVNEGFKALNITMKRNLIGLVAAGVTALGVGFYNLITRVSDLTKAMSDYNAELEKERLRVDALFAGAMKENQEKDTKLKLIREINDKYGDYIGFMLTEKDSNEKLAAAQDLVNAKIRERLALKLREKLQDAAAEDTASAVRDSQKEMTEGFNRTDGITDARSSEARRIVQDVVRNNITLPIDQLLKQVYEALSKEFSSSDNAYTYQDFFKVSEAVEEYIKAMQGYQKEVKAFEDEYNAEINASNEEIVKANYKVLNSITAEWNELKKVKTDTFDNKQLLEHNAQLKKTAEEYVKVAGNQMKLVTGNQKEQLQEYVDYFENAISEVEKISKQKEPNIWGYGRTIEDASVDQLVAKYKQLFDERKTMREDADYSTAYAKEFDDRAEAMDWYLKKLKEIEEQLRKMGYNTSGNFLRGKGGSGSGSSRSEQKQMNDQISAAMAALEAYFFRRQQLIRQSYLNEQITTEEMNRQIDTTEEEHLLARVELRKRLLGEANTFDQDKYGMGDKNLDSTAALIQRLGERQTDGLRKNLENDLLEVQNIAVKYRMSIEKELLKYNPFESLTNQFEESLDKLRLLNTDAEKQIRESMGMDGAIGQDDVKKRMDALVELSQEAYSINEKELRSRLSSIDEVWAASMSPEQISLMLKKLRDFYQDSKAAAEQYAKDIKAMIDVQWETSGNLKMWEDRSKESDDRSELMNAAGSLDLTSNRSSFLGTSETDNAELEALRIRLEAAQEYYEQFYARKEELIQQAIASGATEQQAEEAYRMAEKEALDELIAAREEQSSKELEITESKLSTLKDYTDAVVEFSGQMGEAAFSEVSDRKEAAKQLLQTTMNLTKQLIMQKIQELITKKALKKQEVAIEESGNNSITNSAGSTIIKGLTASEKGMSGKIFGAIAGGSAKIIEELGWWGIPLIAVITAALNGLMSLAMGAFTKSKQEVAVVTGASANSKGRVAAGMLTYAEGDYPVLGNDGQVYNARYQKELKTGVYRGGAHFGIFSEKKPEMIVDGDTTQKLILNYPHIYESILTIARHGQLKSAAMPTFASGSYPDVPASVNVPGTEDTGAASNAAMQETLAGLQSAVAALTERLNKPINATMDPYSANKTLRKTNDFMTKRGLIK